MDNCLPHLSNYQIRQLQSTTDKLQRLLNAAAHVVSNTWKFDRGSTHLLHSELHWLDVPQRIFYKLGVTVHRCLLSKARLPSTSWTAATPHRMLPVVSDFDLLAATISSYHDIVATRSDVGCVMRYINLRLTYLLTRYPSDTWYMCECYINPNVAWVGRVCAICGSAKCHMIQLRPMALCHLCNLLWNYDNK